ncbi:MAG: AAA family ATPase [Bacteroidetes bacterium]|nr:AAA family ATPase [Bacteroidota bacterium]
MKKIALYNIKGGVGKTTTTVNLACMLAKQGLSVLLWDMDPQGGSSFFFGLENKNDNTHGKLFDRYLTIYDVIHHTDTYQIDVIGNDSRFSDQFMNKAARITALNFVNKELISTTLQEVEDDYDVCIIDCSPGRFLLHDNIFAACDLLLIPNIPAPLSVYCNNQLVQELENTVAMKSKIFSFYNMVQTGKTLHKFYLGNTKETYGKILRNYIPFYAEIESISLSKASIFHQLKEFKTIAFYTNLWTEICDQLQWAGLNNSRAAVLPIKETAPVVALEQNSNNNGVASNG